MEKNKNIIIIIGSIIAMLSLAFAISSVSNNFVSKKQQEDINENLIMVNDTIQEITFDSEDDIVLQDENDIIGTLEIPKLEVSAPIKEGINQEILGNYIGQFNNSSIWDGNVCLASHNRGSSVVHYFDRINELVNGDTIIYKTKLGERSYQVIQTKDIENTDWSITENKTKDKNTIT